MFGHFLGFALKGLMTKKGLKLRTSNYHVALDLLTERFSDPQLLISVHIGSLLNLPKVCSINDLQELFLYDCAETEVPRLDCLWLPTLNCGPVLVSVLMEKFLLNVNL